MKTMTWRLALGAMLAGLALALPAARADEPDEADLDSYIEVAGDPAEAKRVDAVDQIAKYGARAKKAIPVLLKCLKAEGELGASAARALAAIGPAAAKEGAPALREQLAKYSNATFQAAVAKALSQLAPSDKQTVKALDDLLGQVLAASTDATPAAFDLMSALTEALGKAGKEGAPAVKNLYAFAGKSMLMTKRG